jgi:GT2 family glycosyltransferase
VPPVDVVVLTYNGKHLLEAMFPSLREQTYDDFNLIVVDNGSTDGSAEYVREQWPTADLFELPENVGVAAALNRGVERGEAPYVALLNNDIELEADWLAELVQALEQHPEAGSATGKLLSFSERDVIDGAGDEIMWSGVTTRRGHGERDHGQFDTPAAIFSASGAASLYRRRAFDVVGSFDEDFYAYLEDVDWGFRAQLAGFSCRYVPSAVGYHMGSATTQKNAAFYRFFLHRNLIALVAKNFPASSLARHSGKVLVYLLVQSLASIGDGFTREHLRGWREAARALPSTVRKRRAIQRSRKVDPAYLESVVSPGWGFDFSLRAAGRVARSWRGVPPSPPS